MTRDAAPLISLHASCVSVKGRGLLILGPSGSGKSSIALQMMALGADLVADDRTFISPEGGILVAHAPTETSGLIEARFVGLLNAPALPRCEVTLVLDLARTETDRLPPERTITLAGITCALAYCSPTAHLPAALMCLLTHGRHA